MSYKWKRILNSLGVKVSLALIVVSIVPLLFNLFFSSKFVENNFLVLEEQTIFDKATQASKVLHAKSVELEKVTTDYAIWDDPYQKIIDKDIPWFKENVTEWLPSNHGVDLIIIANDKKEIIDSYNIDKGNSKQLLKEPKVTRLLNPKYAANHKNYPVGLFRYGKDLYVMGVSPFLKSYYKGTPNGILILGKKITPKLLADIKNLYGYNVFISDNKKFVYSPENQSVITKLSEDDTYLNKSKSIKRLDNNLTVGAVPLKDFNGQTLGAIHIVEPRNNYLKIIDLVRTNGYEILLFSILMILLLSLKLNTMITSPISKLEKQITKMGSENTLDYVKVEGSNEIMSLAMAFNQMITSINQHKDEKNYLWNLSITDELTKVYNHRYLFDYFKELNLSPPRDITLLFCDIDYFKMVNDESGHSTGDVILMEVAQLIHTTCGGHRGVFRYGGEEFVVILDGITAHEGYKIGELIRTNVCNSSKLLKLNNYTPISLSIGIASASSQKLKVEELIKKADTAMYSAKQNGRNQCRIFTQEMEKTQPNPTEIFQEEILINSVYSLAAAIDAKDNYTEKHSRSVAVYSLRLAEYLGLSELDKYILRIGGLLHDCGKIGVPDEVIHKNGPLNDDEWKIIKNHTLLGSNIVKYVIKTQEIDSCIRYHHERWDGKGYPEGLSTTSIPIHARIVCIADAYHSMISNRPYRRALTKDEAFEQLRVNKGIQFDPDLVEPFIEAINDYSQAILEII